MPDTVRKSPPHLKFLAERRASALNEVNVLREAAARTADKLAAAETTLSELDEEIGGIESRIDSSGIDAIRPHAPYRNTPHGHLRTVILEIVRAAGLGAIDLHIAIQRVHTCDDSASQSERHRSFETAPQCRLARMKRTAAVD